MSFIQQFFTSRDNNANAATFVGQEGRLWWDPITNQIYSSDGNTPGGIPLSGGGGNGSPGGANSQVQFNSNGNFGGSGNLTFNVANGTLTAVSFVGDGSALTSITGANVTGTVADSAHAVVADSANSVAGGNVTGNVSNAVHAYFADVANAVAGANVSGTVANATYAVSAGSATTAGTVTTAAQPNITSVGTLTSLNSTGNITGNYFIGNGSQLTGIASNYSNANVAEYLPTYTGNLVALTGNVTTSANVSGAYILGNGSQLTGIISSYGNSNVVSNLAALGSNPVSTTGNVTAGYFVGNGYTLTSVNASNVLGTVANATYATTAGTVTTAAQPNITSVGTLTSLSLTGNISTTGNVAGNYFIGNGSQLTGIVSSYGNSNVAANLAAFGSNPISSTGNITTTANIAGGNLIGTHVGNVTGTTVSVTGNVTGGNLITSGLVSATGNILGGNIGAGGAPNYYNLSGYTAAITIVTPTTGSAIIETVGSTGNAGTIAFGNVNFRQAAISSTVTNDLAFYVNFSGVSNSVAQGLVLYSNLNARFSGAVSAVGNITGGNLLTGGLISVTGNITSAANITGGNLTTAGLITATGNITGGNILGTTASLSGNITGGNLVSVNQVIAGNGSITQPGFRFSGDTDTGLFLLSDGNLAVTTNAGTRAIFFDSGLNVPGVVSASGNVTGGNLLTGGLISATGNITGGNILGGANVNATTHTGTTVSVTANVTGGNIVTVGTVSATGATNATAFAVGNSAVSNVALGMFPTAGTPGEYAIRDHSTVATTMYFDVGMGTSANSVFNFRTSNAYTSLATINSNGITLTTNRPAFRVTGAGTTNNLTTTQNSTGALNGNNWAADYTQGSGLNSTTGVFTAPAAGLYQINVVGRNSGYAGGISQLAVVKNATGGTGAGGTVACMIEWAASSSMNHVGSGTVARLAVNDTLALKVLAGQINFDGNDNWSVAYLG